MLFFRLLKRTLCKLSLLLAICWSVLLIVFQRNDNRKTTPLNSQILQNKISMYMMKENLWITAEPIAQSIIQVTKKKTAIHNVLPATPVMWPRGDCFCDCYFMGYENEYARLTNVILNPAKAGDASKGGERLSMVMNQSEILEYYKFEFGFMSFQCSTTSPSRKSNSQFQSYKFNNKVAQFNHLQTFLKLLTTFSLHDAIPTSLISIEAAVENLIDKGSVSYMNIAQTMTVMLITRYEYANIYYSMTLIYNAYINMRNLNLNPDNIHILITDAHPMSNLDSIWVVLFGQGMSRLNQYNISQQLFIKDMVWVQISYNSPLNSYKNTNVPMLNEFRDFFLARYGVNKTERVLQCNKLRILFIWRRDYIAHPRNPTGHVSRKFDNEEELLLTIQRDCSNCKDVRAIQLDSLSIKEQVQAFVDSDIVIAIHGAGLVYSIFLPRHATVIELFPQYISIANRHFKNIAKWRGLTYIFWKNKNKAFEHANQRTYVEPSVVISLYREAKNKMNCA